MAGGSYKLCSAVECGNLEKVHKILEKFDGDVDAADRNGSTPFALACRRGHIEIMRALLQAGADPRQRWYNGTNYSTAAFLAVDLGNTEMLRLMVQSGISANEKADTKSLLIAAVSSERSCKKDLVALLIENGAEVDLMTNYKFPNTTAAALHKAAEMAAYCHGQLDAVRLLLEAGAAVDLKTSAGKTALFIVCSYLGENTQCFWTPGYSSRIAVAELLLQFGPDVTVECDGRTPIEAVLNCRDGTNEEKLQMVRLLTAHIRPDYHLQKLLYMGARSGSAAATRLFLEHGASPNVPEGEDSPFHVACQAGHHEVAKMLLDAGAAVNAIGREGHGPLTHVVCRPYAKVEEALRTVQLLISRGANVNQSDHECRTPLHWVLRENWTGSKQWIVRLLLQKGADPTVRDVDGNTSLDTVCLRLIPGRPFDPNDCTAADIVSMLLERGSEAEEKTFEQDGLTPFLRAVTCDRQMTLGELLRHQLDCLPDYDE